jgi:hypothetical protein
MSWLISCQKGTVLSQADYNSRANKLIQQVIIDESCSCILEIPGESMINLNIAENPHQDIRKTILNKLQVRDRQELDSLENLSKNFSLDTTFLTMQNVKIIKRQSLRASNKDEYLFTKCPNGVLSILKPIFNKNYNSAVININYTFSDIQSPIKSYKFESNKWKK